jgi:hypothetical protein
VSCCPLRAVHLRHTHDVGGNTFHGDDNAERIRVLIAKLLEEDGIELAEELILTALLDDNGETGDEISSMLANLRTFVVQTPEYVQDNLHQSGFHSDTY